ncbi:MAG: DNA methyltransferase [Bacteroidota bacterium]|nr:DNA methyltransferase [Bacteroidota bacterium]
MRSINKFEIEEIFGRDLNKVTKLKQKLIVDKALRYWQAKGFPYSKLTKKEISLEYKRIENTDCSNTLKSKIIHSSSVGLNLANSFHPQMWHLKSQGHSESPFEHFNNEETLKKLLLRAINFWPNRQCWRAYNVRNLLRIYSGGRVSNFRPTAAKAIIYNLSGENDRILDFCSGFGGRMLGATSLNRYYVGIDASKKQIVGSKLLFSKIKHLCKGNVELHHDCAEDLMKKMDSKSFNLIFTSPPYYDLEKYDHHKNQSYLKYKNYNDWRKYFLEEVVKESYRLLEKNGYLAINVTDSKKYSLTRDLEDFALKYFKFKDKYQLVMNSRPLQRSNGNSYRSEPVFVFQKR